MIDIQNHIRNEGLLNLFDGRSEECQHEYEWRRIERKSPLLHGIPGAGIHIENWWFCKHCGERLITEAERELNEKFTAELKKSPFWQWWHARQK